jgi:peptidoglycan/LPS O-acetylase OafA/YrhL
VDFGQSVFATTLFASNLLFLRESGYFEAASETKPLLHTWSLAVEEQFYIVFPIVLLITLRWLKSRWALVVVPVALSSLLFHLYAAVNQLPQRSTWHPREHEAGARVFIALSH